MDRCFVGPIVGWNFFNKSCFLRSGSAGSQLAATDIMNWIDFRI